MFYFSLNKKSNQILIFSVFSFFFPGDRAVCGVSCLGAEEGESYTVNKEEKKDVHVYSVRQSAFIISITVGRESKPFFGVCQRTYVCSEFRASAVFEWVEPPFGGLLYIMPIS